jgi:ectoine hydroxylase-related dioxygenase (phytanoyl-CoA dioxygenase family)
MAPRLASVAAAGLDEDEACALLHEHGCLVVTGVVPEDACACARQYIDARLHDALTACGATTTSSYPPGYFTDTESHVDAAAYHFGDILAPPHRRDLKLPLDPPVRACLFPALRALQPVLANTLTPDAELVELSSIVADFGAAAQRLHPDTPFSENGFGNHCSLLTVFVALQDVDSKEMGATEICPGTHTREAHVALNARTRDEFFREKALVDAGFCEPAAVLLRAGDCLVMDSRCIHRGGENRDERKRRRVLLYASFSVPYNAPAGSTYSMLRDLEGGGRNRISKMDEWCAPSGAQRDPKNES